MPGASDFLDATGTWQCIRCGACCRLGLYSGKVRRALGLDSLLGSDGWCLHHDHGRRACRIYEDRPTACRDIDAPDLNRAEACAAVRDAAEAIEGDYHVQS